MSVDDDLSRTDLTPVASQPETSEKRINLPEEMRQRMDKLKAREQDWGGGLVAGFGTGHNEALVFAGRKPLLEGGSGRGHNFLVATEDGFKLIRVGWDTPRGESYKDIEAIIGRRFDEIKDGQGNPNLGFGYERSYDSRKPQPIPTLRIGSNGYEISIKPDGAHLLNQQGEETQKLEGIKLMEADSAEAQDMMTKNVEPFRKAAEERIKNAQEEEARKAQQVEAAKHLDSLLD